MPVSLALVTLVVPDYDAAIGFFAGTLGFRLLADTALAGGKRWVVVAPDGGAALLLARAADPRQSAAVGGQAGGRVAFFLHTDDIARDRARWEAAGVRFEAPTRSEPYGDVAVFRDPFGNRWDLVEPSR
jgi:catechol 2,3-dioxygenase-like lactoylglutathione lyase family enzyme